MVTVAVIDILSVVIHLVISTTIRKGQVMQVTAKTTYGTLNGPNRFLYTNEEYLPYIPRSMSYGVRLAS